MMRINGQQINRAVIQAWAAEAKDMALAATDPNVRKAYLASHAYGLMAAGAVEIGADVPVRIWKNRS